MELGVLVPAPAGRPAVQVDAADPAVDAVEGHVVGLAPRRPSAGRGGAEAGGGGHLAGRVDRQRRPGSGQAATIRKKNRSAR